MIDTLDLDRVQVKLDHRLNISSRRGARRLIHVVFANAFCLGQLASKLIVRVLRLSQRLQPAHIDWIEVRFGLSKEAQPTRDAKAWVNQILGLFE